MQNLNLAAWPLDAAWWMRQGEALTYAIYLGLLLLLALAERRAPWHRAAPRRRQRWPANFTLTAVNVVVMGAMPLGMIGAAKLAQDAGFGLLCVLEASTAVAFVATLAARSLLSYGTHRAMHRLPWLWRIHRVHHLDTHLDVSTTVRFHPLETVIQLAIGVPTAFLLGLMPLALVLYEIADAIVNLGSHANLRWPPGVERALRRIVVTPGVHRIHHSTLRAETDSNYGAVLTLWDQVFGTFRTRTASPLAEMDLGLTQARDERTDSAAWLLRSPWQSLDDDASPPHAATQGARP
jgi:sterol desaturase/sphingolipid hydroxylase (fatty acid hydroxylase superfamily)